MNIQPDTLQFLRDLAEHNDRDWFQANKKRYEAAWENVKLFVKAAELRLGHADLIEEGKLFRIYRDVRFSKDKSPYKTNLGAYFSRATPQRRGGYYLHLQPGECFAGGGFWMPESDDLKRIRQEFAVDASSIRGIIAGADFKKYFGDIQGDELKTAPAGFDRDHPDIDLIRKKSYVVTRSFTDEEVTKPNFLDEVIVTFVAMRPFLDYMSEVLTTNLDGESLVG